MLEDEPGLDASSCRSAAAASSRASRSPPSTSSPAIEMMGVEVELYPSMYHALSGQPARCGGSTLPKASRSRMSPSARSRSAGSMSTMCGWSESRDIERAVMAYLAHQKTLAEGAGAAGLAAVLADPAAFPRPQGRAGPVRRQYRSADPRLGDLSRTRARAAASSICASRSTTGRGSSAGSPPSSGSSAPTFWKCRTAGCSSTFPPRAPSSKS